ncbi:MAG: response regulator [Gemmatimonadaceae bacterium]|nr:response regulator [Gemmatimonadaceae bacterium]
MRKSIAKEFGDQRPRAIVLDDNPNARKMTARRLRNKKFHVIECANPAAFHAEWIPGTIDVIVSDWDLSHEPDDDGDRILASVRKRDWDVPFVLVSGKLYEATQRAEVLEHLLESQGAGFVRRGANGIKLACDLAEDLIERRDLVLLKVILALRPAALAGAVIPTTSGQQSAREALEDLVSKPAVSHDAGRPLAIARKNKAKALG